MKQKTAHRFKIELTEIEPLIWRIIEVPSTYSFWDLHVAIQDSMGWLDSHLHVFRIYPSQKGEPTLIGYPNDEYEDGTIPGWETPLSQFFKKSGDQAFYDYDFGDNWQHKVVLEGIHPQEKGKKYPNCVDGERACPPEDCGSIPGYYELLEILKDKNHEEHEDMINWLKGHGKNYHPYDPDVFKPNKVKFDDPKPRLARALSDEDI